MDEVEILHLKKRMEMAGDIYDREIAYMSDHQIFSRLARNGAWDGWKKSGLWEKLEQVYQTAARKKENGWEVEWHPKWQPGLEGYTFEAKFIH